MAAWAEDSNQNLLKSTLSFVRFVYMSPKNGEENPVFGGDWQVRYPYGHPLQFAYRSVPRHLLHLRFRQFQQSIPQDQGDRSD
ncbi:MAG: hypothetical protein EA353_10235 [Puniceicoccaceae bacterium]|nr:MAG: hypothetical protein EA353_10235 [Puniceicoccaceae bacterium]